MLIETRFKILDEKGDAVKSEAIRNPATGAFMPDPSSPDTELRDLVKRALDFFKEGADKKASDLGHRYDVTKMFFDGPTIEDFPQHEADWVMERAAECYAELPLFYGRMRDYFAGQARLAEKDKEPKKRDS